MRIFGGPEMLAFLARFLARLTTLTKLVFLARFAMLARLARVGSW